MENPAKIRKKRGYHHGDLRAQLVEATRALVEKVGPDLFSVSEACREAGVSTAAPYRHFRDKDEMLHAVIREGMARKAAQMQAAVAAEPPCTVARLVAMGRAYVTFARSEPGVFRLVFGATKDHHTHADLMAQGDALIAFVEREVADFLGRDEIDEDVCKRAFLLWTFVHGLSFLLIDEKVDPGAMAADIDSLLREIAQRVMVDPETAAGSRRT